VATGGRPAGSLRIVTMFPKPTNNFGLLHEACRLLNQGTPPATCPRHATAHRSFQNRAGCRTGITLLSCPCQNALIVIARAAINRCGSLKDGIAF
jgi:hypothetical protein